MASSQEIKETVFANISSADPSVTRERFEIIWKGVEDSGEVERFMLRKGFAAAPRPAPSASSAWVPGEAPQMAPSTGPKGWKYPRVAYRWLADERKHVSRNVRQDVERMVQRGDLSPDEVEAFVRTMADAASPDGWITVASFKEATKALADHRVGHPRAEGASYTKALRYVTELQRQRAREQAFRALAPEEQAARKAALKAGAATPAITRTIYCRAREPHRGDLNYSEDARDLLNRLACSLNETQMEVVIAKSQIIARGDRHESIEFQDVSNVIADIQKGENVYIKPEMIRNVDVTPGVKLPKPAPPPPGTKDAWTVVTEEPALPPEALVEWIEDEEIAFKLSKGAKDVLKTYRKKLTPEQVEQVVEMAGRKVSDEWRDTVDPTDLVKAKDALFATYGWEAPKAVRGKARAASRHGPVKCTYSFFDKHGDTKTETKSFSFSPSAESLLDELQPFLGKDQLAALMVGACQRAGEMQKASIDSNDLTLQEGMEKVMLRVNEARKKAEELLAEARAAEPLVPAGEVREFIPSHLKELGKTSVTIDLGTSTKPDKHTYKIHSSALKYFREYQREHGLSNEEAVRVLEGALKLVDADPEYEAMPGQGIIQVRHLQGPIEGMLPSVRTRAEKEAGEDIRFVLEEAREKARRAAEARAIARGPPAPPPFPAERWAEAPAPEAAVAAGGWHALAPGEEPTPVERAVEPKSEEEKARAHYQRLQNAIKGGLGWGQLSPQERKDIKVKAWNLMPLTERDLIKEETQERQADYQTALEFVELHIREGRPLTPEKFGQLVDGLKQHEKDELAFKAKRGRILLE